MLITVAAYSKDGDNPEEIVIRALRRFDEEVEIITMDRACLGYAGEGKRRERFVVDVSEKRDRGVYVEALLAKGHEWGLDVLDRDASVEEMRRLRGHFASIQIREDTLLAVRDHLGCRPLFKAEIDNKLIVSNIPSAIKHAGGEPTPIPMASILKVDAGGERYVEYWRIEDMGDCIVAGNHADALLIALENSVEMMIDKGAAVFFSGGLDSTILAKICLDKSLEPVLVSAGRRDARDWRNIRRAAAILGVDVVEVEIDEHKTMRAVDELKKLLGEISPMDAAIGSVFMIQSEKIREMGVEQGVAGQGADEIFGGYMKYLGILERDGYSGLEMQLLEDILALHRFGLARDSIACSFSGTGLTLPYLTPEVVCTGVSIPAEKKIKKTADGGVVRKHILREVAKRLGLVDIAEVEKSAMQYGTGTQKIVKKLLRKGVLHSP